jgi:hypothetical protein
LLNLIDEALERSKRPVMASVFTAVRHCRRSASMRCRGRDTASVARTCRSADCSARRRLRRRDRRVF